MMIGAAEGISDLMVLFQMARASSAVLARRLRVALEEEVRDGRRAAGERFFGKILDDDRRCRGDLGLDGFIPNGEGFICCAG